jgi:3-oxoacyl-[acyl-carrier-protein] synthase-1
MRASHRAPALPILDFSVCTALGASTAETLAGLARDESGLRPCTLPLPFDTVCGALPTLDALPPSLARYDSPVARIVAHLFEEIAPGVQRAAARWGGDRVAVVLGTSVGGLAVTERALDHEAAHGALPPDYGIYQQHGLYAAAELVGLLAGARGPRFAVSTACSSGAKVFASARRLIRAGLADAVVLGGADSLCQTTLRGFRALSVLSSQPCRPFSALRDGMNLGEGGALFVLAREGDGPARLLGVGESGDAHHMSSPHPEGLGALAAMRDALAQGGLSPSQVDHINAHGTGTLKNDGIEAAAIASLFPQGVPVSSTKGATGHTLGAAGAVEAAFAVFALREGWIPGSLGADPVDPAVHLDLSPTRRPHRCAAVLSNSFGFGGSNASLLLGAP